MIRLGLIGLSPANGHPYSFSAIINGYDDAGMAAATEWAGIHRYLSKADPMDIGFTDARISHIWTQDAGISRSVAAACKIETIADNIEDLGGAVDAVIIARDDYENHAPMAMPFLAAGLPVFIDKPLTLDRNELAVFSPYLDNGQLMSCSGLRYATELDAVRADSNALIGDVRDVHCAVINGWEKYGIHMLEAAMAVFPHWQARAISRTGAGSYSIEMDDGAALHIACLGGKAPVFSINFFGTTGMHAVRISNNFGAFRRTMRRFVDQVKTGEPAIAPHDTRTLMNILIAGQGLVVGERVGV